MAKLPADVRLLLDKIYDEEIETVRTKRRLLLGRMYLFAYPNPKTEAKLPWFDALPLVILFGANKKYLWGINVHHIPWTYRVNFVKKLMARLESGKRLTYRDVKNAWQSARVPNAFAYLAYRTYLVSLIPTNLKMFDHENWKPVTTKVLQKYEKKSDKYIYQEINNALKQQRRKSKP